MLSLKKLKLLDYVATTQEWAKIFHYLQDPVCLSVTILHW